MARKVDKSAAIELTRIQMDSAAFYLKGRTPLIINRMAEKARQELLLPRGRKTSAEKASSIKHDPEQEFRSSAYYIREDNSPTYLALPSACPKKALANAALDIPGAKKSQIGRLTYIEGSLLNVWGKPKLFMSVVRNSDMNKTPDIRTRCIVPEWVMKVDVRYVTPILNETTIANLLHAAGLIMGLGDWRPEKGAGTYGQFDVLSLKDKDKLEHILKFGRDEQIDAMQNPEAYDQETEELLDWFNAEIKTRGKVRALAV